MIYFISDTHLGLNFGNLSPKQRELHLCKFLTQIENTCSELFLVGDIFDFWFEWNKTVPAGFVRILGKLAQMVDNGIKIHFFIGNHDLWINNYLKDEIGLIIHTEPLLTERQNKTLYITHGDTLWNHKGVSKFLEVTLKSKAAKWLSQRMIHPDSMVRFGRAWSASNRKKHTNVGHIFKEEQDNWVIKSREILTKHPEINYFIYGHLHIPLTYQLTNCSQLTVLGEWVENPHYAVLHNGILELKEFKF